MSATQSWRRHLELEGGLNFRDLGGYQTLDGRRVRTGCVFRSAELAALTDADLEAVGALGIRVILDLRSESERSLRPNRLPPGVDLLIRTSPSEGDVRTLEDQIAAGEVPPPDDDFLIELYQDLLVRLAPEFLVVLERAANSRSAPLLFHCAAGKDRTGLAAAVLLGVLGVPDEVVVADFELTNHHYLPRRLEQVRHLLDAHGKAPEDVHHLIGVRPVAMQAALEYVRRGWGGWDGYALEMLGAPEELLVRLRQELLQ